MKLESRKLKFILLVFAVLTLVVGCIKKEEKEITTFDDEVSEEEKAEYKKNCETAAQKAYDIYKSKYTKAIKEGVCSNTSNKYIQITFKVEEKLLYQFRYTVGEDEAEYNETLGNTENHEQCENLPEDESPGLVCASQNLMLSSYETTLDLTDSMFSYQYMMVDLSKLK